MKLFDKYRACYVYDDHFTLAKLLINKHLFSYTFVCTLAYAHATQLLQYLQEMSTHPNILKLMSFSHKHISAWRVLEP